jgi:Holliday junction resolvase RusA-like endonuclease
MTRSDKWRKRKIVEDYRAYKDELSLKLSRWKRDDELRIAFRIRMPKSWSKVMRKRFMEMPHQATPDIDNLMKGFFDALYASDQTIWRVTAEKLWSDEGSITISS